MLIIHQTGSVRVGEVVRYKLTYSPGLDRILPPPKHLHVKIKNTSAVPLRAAYLHGPYTLYVACYPSTFSPFNKHERVEDEGSPDFEPQLKAGGHWVSKLTVPEDVYKDADSTARARSGEPKSFTWIIEVVSQVIFSTSASVHFEVLVGRDEKSIQFGFHGISGPGQGAPGRLEDYQQGRRSGVLPQLRGVFSKAAQLVIDDTESLWNTPSFPKPEHDEPRSRPVSRVVQRGEQAHAHAQDDKPQKKQKEKQKKIHLVLVTHGLHSNLGADMLFLKESIDAAAKQARLDAKKQREELRTQHAAGSNKLDRSKSAPDLSLTNPLHLSDGERDDDDNNDDDDDDDEEVLVRGFSGNVVKTEKGIQYLGKRFAKYVLSITYPDQPYLPLKKKSLSKSIARSFTGSSGRDSTHDGDKKASPRSSNIPQDRRALNHDLPYKITSISFIGHSLGGLIQTYAIAYIQKHSPRFFDLINPVNFIGMASPFLGLSNENPVYVRFALDFGVVGRTGQDLGLTWTPPTLAKNGWGAVISSLASSDDQKRQPNPGAKPLLRILPTGPAHTALKKFRNRTVYSNVVNDGIVPLRTSCLLFLDWSGLERVDKARREYGLVGTMVEWGLAEVLGQNASAPRKSLPWNDLFGDSADESGRIDSSSPQLAPSDPGSQVPQPDTSHDIEEGLHNAQLEASALGDNHLLQHVPGSETTTTQPADDLDSSLWAGLVGLFRPHAGKHHAGSGKMSPKKAKIYRRGQIKKHSDTGDSGSAADSDTASQSRKRPVRGSSLYSGDTEREELNAPPKTSVFESAGDVLNPPLPSKAFIIDPSARPRTIFHDRVYHPDDIPPPPAKRQRTLIRRASSRESTTLHDNTSGSEPDSPPSSRLDTPEVGSMKVEEKIARAYHKDLSWRKVLVRMEPDAHNNMVVRRMFANAYGWPVVKHLCDTHFAYTAAAQTRDEDERNVERAAPAESAVGPEGEHVQGQLATPTKSSLDRAQRDRPLLTRPQTTTGHVPHTDDSVNKIQHDLENMHLQAIKKTHSETLESRDNLSDLVSHVSVVGRTASSYTNMRSGQASASLTRLARKDSDAWSDKYVEDSESGEEDEEILLELQRAQQRGALLTPDQRALLDRLSAKSSFSNHSPRHTTRLGSSRASTATSADDSDAGAHHRPGGLPRLGSSNVLVTEPDEIGPDEIGPEATADEAATPETHGSSGDRTLNLVGVGLGKPIEEQMAPYQGSAGGAVVEHIVHAKREENEGHVQTEPS